MSSFKDKESKKERKAAKLKTKEMELTDQKSEDSVEEIKIMNGKGTHRGKKEAQAGNNEANIIENQ